MNPIENATGAWFGQKVIAHEQLVRRLKYRSGQSDLKEWVAQPLIRPVTGILIGVRTLRNGHRSWDSEGGWSFHSKATVKAWVVAYSLRRRPILIPAPPITTDGSSPLNAEDQGKG